MSHLMSFKFLFNCRGLILFSFIFLLKGLSFGSDVHVNVRLSGSSITNGFLEVEDEDYDDLNMGEFVDVSSFGYVRLGLQDGIEKMFDNDTSTLSVILKIIQYNNAGVPLSNVQSKTLTIKYGSNQSSEILNLNDYRLPGVHKFDVKVIQTKVRNVVTEFKDYVYLQAGFKAERYYKLNANFRPKLRVQQIDYLPNGGEQLLSMSVDDFDAYETVPQADEIILNWDYVKGAEEYDVEWVWVDDYSMSDINTRDAHFVNGDVFRFNSTRIRTSDNSYRISNVFSRGYLICRIRAVGRWMEAPERNYYGQWNDGSYGSYVAIHILSEHGSLTGIKNWQYQATYAEEGKKKEVVQYFDGSLRGRQTVTRINSDGHSVVGETIYDNEGRGVIQILPTVQRNPAISYYAGINLSTQNQSSKHYSHLDFDWEDTSVVECSPAISARLSDHNGSAKYYSTSGYTPSSDQSWQQYVPESHGYAFTQVEYTPDNTGRIRRQSGVGLDHIIGSGHETEYFYGQPSQSELDRLFGYKVGNKQRYKKNMVIDANGQASVSYLDAQGRVIATSLVGTNPETLMPLDSEEEGNHNVLFTDLLGKPSVDTVDVTEDDNALFSTSRFGALNDGLTMSTQIPVTQDGTEYIFDYDAISGQYAELSCDGSDSLRYNFVYDVHVSLRNDCGQELFSNTVTTLGEHGINSTNPTSFNVRLQDTVVLDRGTYSLFKKITINDSSLAVYKQHYLSDANSCLLGPEHFQAVLNTECDTTNPCTSCLTNLGSPEEFLRRTAIDLGYDTLGTQTVALFFGDDLRYYDSLYVLLEAECRQGCTPTNPCEVYHSSMLFDMSPGGQYWEDISQVVYNSLTYNDIDGSPYGVEAYLEQGNYQLLPNGSPSVMVSPSQLTFEDFGLAFQPLWAEVLLTKHPEYKLYEYAEEICSRVASVGDTVLSSTNFDELLRTQVTSIEQAQSPRYFEYDLSVNLLSNTPLLSQDPYFKNTYSSHGHFTATGNVPLSDNTNLTSMPIDLDEIKDDFMNTLLSNYQNTGISALGFAVKTILYGNDVQSSIPPSNFNNITWSQVLNSSSLLGVTMTDGLRDQIFQQYKMYYLSSKAQLNQLLMDLYGFHHNIYNECIGSGNIGYGIVHDFLPYQDQHIVNSAYFMGLKMSTSFANFILGNNDLGVMSLCTAEYNDKSIRISRVSTSGFTEDVSELEEMVDFQLMESTGLCPLVVDIERLLNDLLTNHLSSLSSSQGVSQGSVLTFVPDLYEAFTNEQITVQGGGSYTNVNLKLTSNEIRLSQGAEHLGEIVLTNPVNSSTGTLNWNSSFVNNGGSWRINGVTHSAPAPQLGSHGMLLLLSATNMVTQTTEEFTFGYTITNVNTGFTPAFTCSQLAGYTSNPASNPMCEERKDLESNFSTLFGYIGLNGFASSASQHLNDLDGSLLGGILYGEEILNINVANLSKWRYNSANNSYRIGTDVNYLTFSFNSPQATLPSSFVLNDVDLEAISNGYFGIKLNLSYIDQVNGNNVYRSNVIFSGRISTHDRSTIDICNDCPENKDRLLELLENAFDDVLSYGNNALPGGFQPHGWDTLSTYFQTYSQSPSNLLIWSHPHNPFVSSRTILLNIPSGNQGRIRLDLKMGETPLSNGVYLTDLYNWSYSTSNNSYPYVPNIEVTGVFSDNITRTLSFKLKSCRMKYPDSYSPEPPCDCPVAIEPPVSCTDKYSVYKSHMSEVYGAVYDSLVGTEYHITEEAFCKASLAYITDAYIHYLDTFQIHDTLGLDSVNYLPIGEFGDTRLGYSHDLLIPAINQYVGSIYSNPHSTQYIPWNHYVTNKYMVENDSICPGYSPPPYELNDIEIPEKECNEWENNVAEVNAQNQQGIYLDQMGALFEQAYIERGISSLVEHFNEKHTDKEYHYTLYYYDRAGNLVQTVPPKGVNRLEYDQNGNPIPSYENEENGFEYTAAFKQAIINKRTNDPESVELGSTSFMLAPKHLYGTQYRYNSLNQLVWQKTPDGGVSRFAYDQLGRLVLSQNAKQEQSNLFSYTKYDELGRVVEVGEMVLPSAYKIKDGKLKVYNFLFVDYGNAFPNNLTQTNRHEVTRTIYDELAGMTTKYNGGNESNYLPGNASVQSLFGDTYHSNNTRNRIVGVVYQEQYNANINVHESGTFYDYDVHGNVAHLIQVNGQLPLLKLNQHIKHVEYEYDLVSGNVNKVVYQRNKSDQFIHRYCYDADNRITIAETSKDGIYFERDAKYFYYGHGPLARTELGHTKAQSLDYAYTIQGWLKSVNGDQVGVNMMGQDGKLTTLNQNGARDVFGFNLSYYNNDYHSYATTNNNMLNYDNTNTGAGLYNGNIRSMFTALSNIGESALKTHQTVYRYDQLNRIKSMRGYFRELSISTAVASNYSSDYSFDANGNLRNLRRNAPTAQGAPRLMDNFSYHYNETINGGYNNRLSGLRDHASHNNFVGDIERRTRYKYDEIGQLIYELSYESNNEIETTIKWKVTNKVSDIIKSDEENRTETRIHFDYDAMGNRIAKTVYENDKLSTATYYFLDAQGNPMSTYTYQPRATQGNASGVHLSERNIYGSSRIGIEQLHQKMGMISLYSHEVVNVCAFPIRVHSTSSPDTREVSTINGTKEDSKLPPYHVIAKSDFDNDGDLDIRMYNNMYSNPSSPNPVGMISSHCFARINLPTPMVGQQYRLNFNLDQMGSLPVKIQYLTQTNNYSSTGAHTFSFVANSAVSSITISSSVPRVTMSNVLLELIVAEQDEDDAPYIATNKVGDKRYELSNHLGNVLQVITDRKLPVEGTGDLEDKVAYYSKHPANHVL